jgi:hypothetical protein
MAGAQDENRQYVIFMFDLFFLFYLRLLIYRLLFYSFKKQSNRQDYNTNTKRKNSFGERKISYHFP